MISSLHLLHRFGPALHLDNTFLENDYRSFLALHEAILSGQSILSCAGCAACLTVAEWGEASDGQTAAVCAGAVVRNDHYCRVVRCEARRLRVVRDREYRNADLEPAGAARGATSSADTRPVGALLAHAMASVAAVTTSHRKLPEPAVASAAVPATDAATVDPGPRETAFGLAGVSAAEAPVVEASLPDSRPTPPPETRVRLVSLFRPDPVAEDPQPAARPVETLDECLVVDICIDEYLWSLYERTPKVDTNKMTERIKTTVKVKGKTRTVTKTITKYVVADFTRKDPIAAQRAGMSLKDYVIGGMDRGFKLKLFRALRTMDDAGFMPGITSAFRDDYRQSIASDP
jgi:hypothetical protein